jgi:hypothetical protein
LGDGRGDAGVDDQLEERHLVEGRDFPGRVGFDVGIAIEAVAEVAVVELFAEEGDDAVLGVALGAADLAVAVSGCIAGLDMKPLAQGRECRLDLVQAGMMAEREEAFDVGFGYADAAGKFSLLEAGLEKSAVEIDFGGLECREQDGAEPGAAVALGDGQRLGFADVVAEGQHEEILRHVEGFLIGFALGDARNRNRERSRRSRLPGGRAQIMRDRFPFRSSHLQIEVLKNALDGSGFHFFGGMTRHAGDSGAEHDPCVARFFYERAFRAIFSARWPSRFNGNHL